ncbi:MAG: Trm112 family protein [Gemmatimonadota bacterium]|jgi:uncharacterized protein YbaR (Trm112 family)
MHLLLTDRLTCPRCGPTFGLILLADRIDDRMVLEGRLGCPNCRDSFPIRKGFADLRAPPRDDPPAGLAGSPAPGEDGDAERVVALLGVAGGPGAVALVGEPARYARVVTAIADEIHVVAVDPDLQAWPEEPRTSRMMAGPGLPVFSSTLRAVAVDGRLGRDLLAEAARVVAPRGRVVVVHAPEGTEDWLVGKGLDVLASETETVVAARG